MTRLAEIRHSDISGHEHDAQTRRTMIEARSRRAAPREPCSKVPSLRVPAAARSALGTSRITTRVGIEHSSTTGMRCARTPMLGPTDSAPGRQTTRRPGALSGRLAVQGQQRDPLPSATTSGSETPTSASTAHHEEPSTRSARGRCGDAAWRRCRGMSPSECAAETRVVNVISGRQPPPTVAFLDTAMGATFPPVGRRGGRCSTCPAGASPCRAPSGQARLPPSTGRRRKLPVLSRRRRSQCTRAHPAPGDQPDREQRQCEGWSKPSPGTSRAPNRRVGVHLARVGLRWDPP